MNPHPTWQFSHTQFSWAPPPDAVGMHPHSCILFSVQQSHGYLHPMLWGCVPMIVLCFWSQIPSSHGHLHPTHPCSHIHSQFGHLTGHPHPPALVSFSTIAAFVFTLTLLNSWALPLTIYFCALVIFKGTYTLHFRAIPITITHSCYHTHGSCPHPPTLPFKTTN